MKRKFLVTMMAALALTLAMSGIGQAFVMNGNVLTVGIDNSGGLVDLGAPPAFAGDNGQGITFKSAFTPNDFTGPGTPWEFYSLGVRGAFLVGGVPGAAANPMGLNTVNNSAGAQFKADSNGPAFALGGAMLSYDQSVAFDINSNVIKFKADIFNVGNTTATNVVYARGLDPDQDVGLFGSFVTTNSFPAAGQVLAVGTLTPLSVLITDVSGGGIASISGSAPSFPWETNPYVLALGGLVNGAAAGNPFDYSINMAWELGDILPGHSVQIDWTYTFVPVPPSLVLLGSGLLGLIGFRFRRNQA